MTDTGYKARLKAPKNGVRADTMRRQQGTGGGARLRDNRRLRPHRDGRNSGLRARGQSGGIVMGGKVSVWASQPGTIGRATVGTAAAAIGTAAINGVALKASGLNSGTIFVGFGSAVDDETGFPLEADEGLSLDIRQLSDIWAMASADDQYLHFAATED